MTAPHTGTTVVAITYKDGVVIGADSRVSMGAYISNRASDKITPLAENVWLLRSGSAADTQAIADYGNESIPQPNFDTLILLTRRHFHICDCSPSLVAPAQCGVESQSQREGSRQSCQAGEDKETAGYANTSFSYAAHDGLIQWRLLV